MAIRIFQFSFLLLFLFNSCQKNDTNYFINITNHYEDKGIIEIINQKNKLLVFELDVNNQFPLTEKKLLSQIEYWADSLSLPLYQATWKYVCENTKHNDPIPAQKTLNNSFFFLNSFGYGLCENRAFLLADLWRKFGYKSRIYHVYKHAVAEVYINGKWEMYDPDHEVFYYNNNNQVASVSELASDKTCFSRPSNRSLDELSDVITNSEFIIKKFSYANQGLIDSTFVADNKTTNMLFKLPPNAKMRFPIIIPYKEGVFYTFTKAVEITLYENNKSQPVQLPLYPYMDVNHKDTTFLTNSFGEQLNYSNVKDSTKVYFLLNPRLPILKNGKNELIITTEDLLSFDLKIKEDKSLNRLYYEIQNDTFLFSSTNLQKINSLGELQKNYLNYINYLEEKYSVDLSQKKLVFNKQFNNDSLIFLNEDHLINYFTMIDSSSHIYLFQLFLTNNDSLLPQLINKSNF